MKLDAVEPRRLGPRRRVREYAGQYLRQIANVRQVDVGDALPIAELERFELAVVQHALEFVVAHRHEHVAELLVGLCSPAERTPMVVCDDEEPA